jgi:hypothetical protein
MPPRSRAGPCSAGAAALAATAQWTPLGRVAAASAATTIPAPPHFPSGISLYQQTFQNWSGEVVVEGCQLLHAPSVILRDISVCGITGL